MLEKIELRIPEVYAKEFLDATDGVCLGGSVRKVEVHLADPRFSRIGDLDRAFQRNGKAFFTAWSVRRRYTPSELRAAKSLQLLVKRVFEPTGEQFGTLYDESTACHYCGSGGRQVSDLILEPRSLQKLGKLDIAKTIGGEIVVSESFVEMFQANDFQGAEFRKVQQRNGSTMAAKDWYQFIVVSTPLAIVAPTRAGVTPFDDRAERQQNQKEILEHLSIKGSWCDTQGEYRCPLGHTIGLNLLSELSVEEVGFDGCDIALTKQHVGVRRGLLRPEPMLLISPRLWESLIQQKLSGMNFEVVHLVPS
jgi:hypothetical protein